MLMRKSLECLEMMNCLIVKEGNLGQEGREEENLNWAMAGTWMEGCSRFRESL
jgi:hypothetical protein